MKKINWKLLIISIIIPLAVGGLAALITMGSMDIYDDINLPAFAPPSWLFGPVWLVLYVLMGIALYKIVSSKDCTKEAIFYFGLQLLFNFVWPIAFFNFRLFWFAFVWLVVLDILIVISIIKFYKINKSTVYLLLPYILWTLFATILNLSIAILN